MNRQDLIEIIAAECSTKATAGQVVDLMLSTMQLALVRGEDVSFKGFGSFSVADRAASEGRNPRTGEKLQIAAKRVVKFKASASMSSALNPGR